MVGTKRDTRRMPGKLKDDSASLRMVLLDDDRYYLREMVRTMGLNQTGVIRTLIREGAARRGIKPPPPPETTTEREG